MFPLVGLVQGSQPFTKSLGHEDAISKPKDCVSIMSLLGLSVPSIKGYCGRLRSEADTTASHDIILHRGFIFSVGVWRF